ncbi:MAG: MFS transporter [Gaiellaceae bacterium]
MSAEPVRLGLRANAAQFFLLVGLNAFVGAMVGLERSVLPLVGERDFGLQSKAAILSFVVAFGIAKALANLAAGGLADRVGRKRLLVLGWALALPVPVLIALAPNWGWIVAANLLLGANQGLAWSMTVVMKIDLVGPLRRGLALGLNESAGYLGVAITAFATGALAASFAPRTLVWVGGAAIAALGTALSLLFVRDTSAHVAREQRAHGHAEGKTLWAAFAGATVREPMLRACSQAGLVNNLNDALAWGLVPLYLAADGASATEIGIVAGVYPAVWGAGQLLTGWLSDHAGRKPLITGGMLVQAGALALLVAGGGAFASALVAAIFLGIGTALVYPTLIAAVSDGVQPVERAPAVGVYRFWRDFGFVVGALVAGLVADAAGAGAAIAIVAALTAGSGLWVSLTRWTERDRSADRRAGRRDVEDLLADARRRIAPRLEPDQAHEAQARGALIVDLRSRDERQASGVIPGSIHIPRSVLEWRADPDCEYRNPAFSDLERELVLMCADGFSSSLAAASLRELGWRRATDLVGGFNAWNEAGLPVRAASQVEEDRGLPGMGPPEPLSTGDVRRDPHPLMVPRDGAGQRIEEVDMRAIECPCGHHLEGADDEELFRLARQHVEEHHPDMERSDEQLRARVAADAYDVVPSTS